MKLSPRRIARLMTILLASAGSSYRIGGSLQGGLETRPPVLVGPPPFTAMTFEQSAGGGGELPRPAGATFKKAMLSDEIYELQYKFQNFNRHKLTAEFTVVQAELESSLSEFGYSKSDLDRIYQQYSSQGEGPYVAKVNEYFMKRGFRVISKDTVMVDVPLMVRRNLKRVNGLALALQRIGEARSYDSEDLIGAATALVQTAMAYRLPPNIENGRHIGGIHPPPKALVDGWGDCDTKSALLATVLASWRGIRGVGVALPKHYLIGIARIPRQGDLFVEHGGIQYVLIEPAGPAWLPPGTVGDDTVAMLNAASGIPIQPF
jgi:hypothetical protein